MKTTLIPIENIRPNPDNPNPHTPEQVETLAANIGEFGLIQPIVVRPVRDHNGETGRYEVVVGHGRLRAYEKLWADARSNKQTQKWAEIPAVIIYDQTDYGTWGRNLSENKLRSFNWQAECVCFARMRLDGKDKKEIGKIFGVESEASIQQRIALGDVPGLEKLNGITGYTLIYRDARDYLLPLRVQTGYEESGAPTWDYSEVTACIDKLVSGELTRETLPAYVTERRLAIQEAQQERKFKEIAAQELAVMRDKLSEKDKEVKAANDKIQVETKRLQEQAVKQAASLKSEYEEKVKKATTEIAQIRSQMENAGDEKAELLRQIEELQEDSNLYAGQVTNLENQIATLREQVENEVAERIKAEMLEQLRKEIQAEKNAEADEELNDAYDTIAREREELDHIKHQLEKRREDFKRKEKALEEEKKRLDAQREKAAQLQDINGWIKIFNRFSDEFINLLGVANTQDYWAIMEKPELKRIYSSLSGISDQLRQIETNFQSRGILGENRL